MTDKKLKSTKKKKLYCYVDETGQDTKGKLFIVALIVTGNEKSELENKLLEIEKRSNKGDRKWQKSRKKERLEYINAVIESNKFKDKLNYNYFDGVGINYYHYIIFSIVKLFLGKAKYKNSNVDITIDALEKSKRKIIGSQLRKYGIRTNQIKGKKDESSALLRLADAVAGLVRDGIEKHPDYKKVYNRAIKENIIKSIN